MKAFFEVYQDPAKLAPMVREIGWAHNVVILQRRKGCVGAGVFLALLGLGKSATNGCTN